MNSAEVEFRKKRGITPKRYAVLSFVFRYTYAHGCPPCIRDIMQEFGFTSLTGYRSHVDALCRKGLLRSTESTARSFVVTPRGIEVLNIIQPIGRPTSTIAQK